MHKIAKQETEDYSLCSVTRRRTVSCLLPGDFLCLSEDGADIFDMYDKKTVIAFEIDRNCVLGIEQRLVVLAQPLVLDLGAAGPCEIMGSGHRASSG